MITDGDLHRVKKEMISLLATRTAQREETETEQHAALDPFLDFQGTQFSASVLNCGHFELEAAVLWGIKLVEMTVESDTKMAEETIAAEQIALNDEEAVLFHHYIKYPGLLLSGSRFSQIRKG